MQISFHSALAIAHLQSAAHYRAAPPGCQIEQSRQRSVALAARKLIAAWVMPPEALLTPVAAVSVGGVDGEPLLDLYYGEDVHADMDMNVVMNRDGHFIEVQGTAERQPFDRAMLNRLLDLAVGGIESCCDCKAARWSEWRNGCQIGTWDAGSETATQA